MNKKNAVDGVIKCFKNAESLIEDAQILFKKNRPVGTALLVTAIEEYGKAILIFSYFNGIISKNIFQRAFRSHLHKRAFGSFIALIGTVVVDGAKDAVKFKRLLKKLDFDAMRDSVLYVNYKNNKFISPIENKDLPNFHMVLRLALRLKRIFAAISDEQACAQLFEETWDIEEKECSRSALINKLLRIKLTE